MTLLLRPALPPALALVLFAPTLAAAQSWADNLLRSTNQKPHPAVVRVIATNDNGASLGSGALVAVSEQHGLVITNWHVVRDAAGAVLVAFPDGFRSPAMVLKADRDWDLAALAIWRPPVQPIPLAQAPARPGEPLTIAGYGSGNYREATGRCTQYVSPGGNKPFEMVELSAGARQGDSGGPILNQRGELAGVLFGTAGGQTTGSYCGRVVAFLTPVVEDFRRLQPNPMLLAQQPPGPPPPASPPPQSQLQTRPPPAAAPVVSTPLVSIPASPRQGNAAPNQPDRPTAPPAPQWAAPPAAVAGPPPAGPETPAGTAQAGQEPSTFEQIRNYLAAIGVFAIFFHGLRLIVGGKGR